MANITFRIRHSRNTDQPARLIADVVAFRRRKFITSNVKINPEEWNQQRQRPKPTCINRKLVEIEISRIRTAVNESYYLAGENAEAFFNALNLELVAAQEDSFQNLWREFIEASNYAPRTEMKMQSTLKLVLKYSPKVQAQSMGLQWADRFKQFLFKRELSNETVSKYLQCVKRFLSWSFDRGLHSNNDFKHPDFGVPRKEKVTHVALSEEEVQQIREADLPKRLEDARDLFLWSCYTGQRWSDIERINSAVIEGGVLHYTPHKTRKHNTVVRVPLVGYSAPALEIYSSHADGLPKMLSQVFNRQVKEVCRLSGVSGVFQKVWISGKKEEVRNLSRVEHISAHTGRRTFATVLLTKGVPLNIVAKMTGHKSIRTLEKYEQASSDYALEMYMKNFSS
jgi:integrase